MSGLVVISAADLVGSNGSKRDAVMPIRVSNPQQVGAYNNKHRILVVGDGNLSFSLSLASFLGGDNIVASCYDSEEVFRQKYPSDAGNIRALKRLGGTVLFNVDATKLDEDKRLSNDSLPFDRVIFNFPHTGVEGSTIESIKSNEQLLFGYFTSASQIINPLGQIHLTLRDTTFYQSWNMPEQAKLANLSLIKKVPFDADMYVGYVVCRTTSGELMRQAPSTENAFQYFFELGPEHSRAVNKNTSLKKRKRRESIKKKKKPTQNTETKSLFCKVCNIQCANQSKFNGHINSPKHSKNLKKAKQQNQQPPKKKRKTK